MPDGSGSRYNGCIWLIRQDGEDNGFVQKYLDYMLCP